MRHRGRSARHVLVVGSGRRARHVLHHLQRHPEWRVEVVGFLDEGDAPHDPRISREHTHKLSELPSLLRSRIIDEVIVACPRTMLGELGPVVATCAAAGIPMTVLSDLFGDYLPPPRVTRFGSLAALSFAPVHHSRSQLAAKRLLDVACAALGLLLSAPVIVVAAADARRASGGRVFQPRVRSGRRGRPFHLWKLRTGVTLVGRFLRRWRLDELPQLWSVLRGEMSLVGPRPAAPHELAEYETFDRRRLSMRPGITCLHASERRESASFADRVRLDLEYVDSWSLWLDLKILLHDLWAAARSGASGQRAQRATWASLDSGSESSRCSRAPRREPPAHSTSTAPVTSLCRTSSAPGAPSRSAELRSDTRSSPA